MARMYLVNVIGVAQIGAVGLKANLLIQVVFDHAAKGNVTRHALNNAVGSEFTRVAGLCQTQTPSCPIRQSRYASRHETNCANIAGCC